MDETTVPAFVCDAMLGGLARWLRGAGYDAAWRSDISDWEVIRQAQTEGRLLLSSDRGIFQIGIVRDGEVPALFIPAGLGKLAQLTFVMDHLRLSVQPPRCMACGGRLSAVPKERVRERVPPRTFGWLERYEECVRCGRLFWQGTHWRHIDAVLQSVACRRGGEPDIAAGKKAGD